jgi:hypothetical protein
VETWRFRAKRDVHVSCNSLKPSQLYSAKWFSNQVSYKTTDGQNSKRGIGNSRKRVVYVPQKEQAGQGHRLRLWAA